MLYRKTSYIYFIIKKQVKNEDFFPKRENFFPIVETFFPKQEKFFPILLKPLNNIKETIFLKIKKIPDFSSEIFV